MNELVSGGVLGFWTQADAVGRLTAGLLLLMSVATWYLIVTKTLQFWRARRYGERALKTFWEAPELAQGIEQMRAAARDSPFFAVAAEGAAARAHHDRHARGGLADSLPVSEFCRQFRS